MIRIQQKPEKTRIEKVTSFLVLPGSRTIEPVFGSVYHYTDPHFRKTDRQQIRDIICYRFVAVFPYFYVENKMAPSSLLRKL